jgi:osmotically inducible protein OsmC
MGISKASAQWDGTLKAGAGVMRPAHAPDVAYSFGSRFGGEASSNPEELLGAALAGCFSMALSVALERAGATPRSVSTTADVKLEKVGEGFGITGIDLVTSVAADGLDDAKFQELADATKKGCPVSKALASVENVTLKATLIQPAKS